MSLQYMVLGKLDCHMQKSELVHSFIPYTIINSGLIKDMNVRPEIMKCKKEKMVKESML